MTVGRARWVHGVSASICLFLFVCLAAAMSSGATMPFDNFFLSGIHRWASPSLTMLAYGVSLLGSVAVLAILFAIALVGFWIVGRPRPKIVLAWAMGGAVVLDNVLKYSFHRVRPEPFFGTAPESYSFPSGHMLFSCCFYGALVCILAASFRNGLSRAIVWATVVVLVTAIGLSRIYLGFHYPTDVIGGLLIATFWIDALRSFGTFNDVTKRL